MAHRGEAHKEADDILGWFPVVRSFDKMFVSSMQIATSMG